MAHPSRQRRRGPVVGVVPRLFLHGSGRPCLGPPASPRRRVRLAALQQRLCRRRQRGTSPLLLRSLRDTRARCKPPPFPPGPGKELRQPTCVCPIPPCAVAVVTAVGPTWGRWDQDRARPWLTCRDGLRVHRADPVTVPLDKLFGQAQSTATPRRSGWSEDGCGQLRASGGFVLSADRSRPERAPVGIRCQAPNPRPVRRRERRGQPCGA